MVNAENFFVMNSYLIILKWKPLVYLDVGKVVIGFNQTGILPFDFPSSSEYRADGMLTTSHTIPGLISSLVHPDHQTARTLAKD